MTLNRAREQRTAAVLLVVAGALLLGLALRAAGRAESRNTGDFVHFYLAAKAVRDGTDPLAAGIGGYIYPPLLAVAMAPLAVLSELSAARLWIAVNAALIVATLWIGVRVLAREWGERSPARLAGAVLLAMGLTLEPLRWELELGQTDTLVLLGMVASLACLSRWPSAAGAWLGFAANIKYVALAALPWMVLRQRWRAATATVACSVLIALAPAAVIGWEKNLDYLGRALGGLAGSMGVAQRAEGQVAPHGLTWHRSVSLTSAAGRIAEAGGLGFNGSVAISAAFLGAALLAVALVYRRRRERLLMPRGRHDALEWCAVIMGLLIFAPQTTTRHMYLMLLPNLAAGLLLLRPGRGKWPLIAGVLAFQLATRLPPGGGSFQDALTAWRWIGGACWGLLAMLLGFLATGLAQPGLSRPGDAR
ncbi:MAG: glycosyltransferase family 87 protein [Phycisphaerales bacterium]